MHSANAGTESPRLTEANDIADMPEVAALAARRGIPDATIAQLIDLSKSHYSRIRRGLSPQPPGFRRRLEEALGVAPGTLAVRS